MIYNVCCESTCDNCVAPGISNNTVSSILYYRTQYSLLQIHNVHIISHYIVQPEASLAQSISSNIVLSIPDNCKLCLAKSLS